MTRSPIQPSAPMRLLSGALLLLMMAALPGPSAGGVPKVVLGEDFTSNA